MLSKHWSLENLFQASLAGPCQKNESIYTVEYGGRFPTKQNKTSKKTIPSLNAISAFLLAENVDE